MKISKFMLLFVIVFVIIIILLFIELNYNKNHALMVFVAPEKVLVIKGKTIGEKDDVVIYNSQNCSTTEAINKLPKYKRNNYHEQKICSHISKKITKPFDESFTELKESFGENMPVSFVYKTALNIVDLARDLTTPNPSESIYKMLVSNNQKHMAFIDNNNIYLK